MPSITTGYMTGITGLFFNGKAITCNSIKPKVPACVPVKLWIIRSVLPGRPFNLPPILLTDAESQSYTCRGSFVVSVAKHAVTRSFRWGLECPGCSSSICFVFFKSASPLTLSISRLTGAKYEDLLWPFKTQGLSPRLRVLLPRFCIFEKPFPSLSR